jgi:hypothetical protein
MKKVAESIENVLSTLGETGGALHEVWGVHNPN